MVLAQVLGRQVEPVTIAVAARGEVGCLVEVLLVPVRHAVLIGIYGGAEEVSDGGGVAMDVEVQPAQSAAGGVGDDAPVNGPVRKPGAKDIAHSHGGAARHNLVGGGDLAQGFALRLEYDEVGVHDHAYRGGAGYGESAARELVRDTRVVLTQVFRGEIQTIFVAVACGGQVCSPKKVILIPVGNFVSI